MWREAIALTDVSGMSDPWESFRFSFPEQPLFFIKRLPLLVIALAIVVWVWTVITSILLSDRPLSWQVAVWLPGCFITFELALTVVTAGYLLFETPWPILPVGMYKHFVLVNDLQLWLWEGNESFADNAQHRLIDIGKITALRLAILTSSLLLIRGAGWRLPARRQKLVTPALEPAAS